MIAMKSLLFVAVLMVSQVQQARGHNSSEKGLCATADCLVQNETIQIIQDDIEMCKTELQELEAAFEHFQESIQCQINGGVLCDIFNYCYDETYSGPLSYTAAQEFCAAKGGHLWSRVLSDSVTEGCFEVLPAGVYHVVDTGPPNLCGVMDITDVQTIAYTILHDDCSVERPFVCQYFF